MNVITISSVGHNVMNRKLQHVVAVTSAGRKKIVKLQCLHIMKKKRKQCWSTIPTISTYRIITYLLNSLNIKKGQRHITLERYEYGDPSFCCTSPYFIVSFLNKTFLWLMLLSFFVVNVLARRDVRVVAVCLHCRQHQLLCMG